MSQTNFSLSETRNIQEEARQKYADGQYTLAEYLAVIFKNPLKFTSTKRTQVIVTKEKGRFRVTANQPQYVTEDDK